MKEFKESEIKYLAGLLDADGCLSLTYNNRYIGMTLSLELAESCDRDGKYIKSLANRVGSFSTRKREENWSRTNSWRVGKRSDLEMLLPRIIKHMVIKGKHWQNLLNLYRDYKGVVISSEEYEEIKKISTESRENSGPLKPKIHPTWAWVTGYLEGDGWFMIRHRPRQIEMQVGAVCREGDVIALELLQKAFGGILKEDRGHMRWIKNLGPKDKAFAIRFCTKLLQHSRLKTHKIETILSIHSQRLNEITPAGDVIV